MEGLSQESALMASQDLNYLFDVVNDTNITSSNLFSSQDYGSPGALVPSEPCDSTQQEDVNYDFKQCNLVEPFLNNASHYEMGLIEGNQSNVTGSSDLRCGPTGIVPSTDNYSGPFDFQIEIPQSSSVRRAWVLSKILHKVYINVDKVLLVQFKINGLRTDDMKVRALLVYTAPDDMKIPVSRCSHHSFLSDSNNSAHAIPDKCECRLYNMVGHVLTTDQPKAIYEYNAFSQRHSVTVPVEPVQPGYGENITVAYKFGCKTSCLGGMSRRPVSLIFTLEKPGGEVVGRCSLLVKVCSCPKRDKERDESDFMNSNKSVIHSGSPHVEKRKIQQQQSDGGAKRAMTKRMKNDPSIIVQPQQQQYFDEQQLQCQPQQYQEVYNNPVEVQIQNSTVTIDDVIRERIDAGFAELRQYIDANFAEMNQRLDSLFSVLLNAFNQNR